MEIARALLEEWYRKYYFEAEIDIGSSGVQNFSLAGLRDIISLSEEDLNRVVFNDSPTHGNERLRKAIAQRWGNGDPTRVMATHGSSEVIFLIINALLRPNDEIVVLDPSYFSYRNLVESKGGQIKPWRLHFEQQFNPDMEELKGLITPHTRMVIVNFPHNPTGASVGVAEQKELVRAVAEVGAYLVWDGAFSHLTHDSAPLSDPHLVYDRAISIGTLSKAYGLAGLRVGWCLAAPDLLERFVHLRDYTTLYLSPLVELIAERAIERADHILQMRLEQARANLRILDDWINQHGELVEWVRPRGGVTALVYFRRIPDVEAFCHRLAQQYGVLLVPGTCFNYPGYVRLGFGSSTDAFQIGLNRLSQLLQDYI